MKNEMAGASRKYGVMLATWVAFGWPRLAFPADPVPLGDAVTSTLAASEYGGNGMQPFRLKLAQTIGASPTTVKAIAVDGEIVARFDVSRPLSLKFAETIGALPAISETAMGATQTGLLPQDRNAGLPHLKLAEVMGALPPVTLSDSAVAASQADHLPLRLKLAQEIGSLPAASAIVTTPLKTVVASDQAEDQPVSRLRLAPIQYGIGGDVGYTLQKQTTGESELTSQFLSANVRANANSFIWQPWFAQVKGGLGLGFSQSNASSSKSSSNTILGNGILSLLPSSRFPFEAHFNRSNNSQNIDLGTGSSSKTTSYGMSQRYRPRSGSSDYFMSYDHELWESSNQYKANQDSIKANATQQFEHQTLGVNGEATRNTRSDGGDSTLTKMLTANHNYRPNPVFSVESLANLMQTNYNFGGGGTTSTYLQFNSSAFWRPAEKPFTVNGSLRLYELGTESTLNNAATSTMRTVNANIGANYTPSTHIQLSGSGNVNVTETSGGSQIVNTSETIGASYQPDVISLGKYSYNRSVSSAFTNSTDDVGSKQHFTLSPSHGLTRGMDFGSGKLTMSMQQGASADVDSQNPSILNMTHNGSLGWGVSKGRKNTMLRLTASDSRTVVGSEYFAQMINMQATLDETFNRFASWNGNLTMQIVRQGAGTTPATTNTIASADLGYRHQRAFNVPRLRFTSDLRITGDAYIPVLATPDQQDSVSWDNRLDYSIGLTQFRLTARLAKVNKVTQSLYLFSLTRQF